MRKLSVILMTMLVVAFAASAIGQVRRVVGKVKDDLGQPLAGALAVVTSSEAALAAKAETNKKGEYQIIVASGAAHSLHLTITMEGYAPYKSDIHVDPGASVRSEVTLQSIARFQEAHGPTPEQKAANRAIELHNLAVEATNSKDWVTASQKFDEALALKEESAATHLGAATAAWNQSDFAKAERHARRSLELQPEQEVAMSLLAESLDKQDKTQEADAIRQKLAAADPKLRASLAYNRGADLANTKPADDAGARKAFEEAVAADPDLAEAHFALGLTTYRLGDMPAAKVALSRFLELLPESAQAKTARDLLKTIK